MSSSYDDTLDSDNEFSSSGFGSSPQVQAYFSQYQLPADMQDDDGQSAEQKDAAQQLITPPEKVINDPVQGFFKIEGMLMRVIDTPYVQRLRDLKQLGAASWVFPGGSHNRFQHSLGTMHMAGKMAENLRTGIRKRDMRDQDGNPLEVTDRHILLVKLAGLCHDLGHGPFSHVFDGLFIPEVVKDLKASGRNPDLAERLEHWEHEEASEMMLEAAVKASGIMDSTIYSDPLTDRDVLFVKQLINPKRHEQINKENPSHEWPVYPEVHFLFDIVSNARNSIDVDKFDYLLRDANNCGLEIPFNPDKLLDNCAVQFVKETGKHEVCFARKADWNIYELFYTRYTLFKQIYSHRKVKCVEYMISDALIAADPALKIVDRIFDAESYLRLNDCIIDEIEKFDFQKAAVFQQLPTDHEYHLSTAAVEGMRRAQAILKRLRHRQIYRYCAEVLLPKQTPQDVLKPINSKLVYDKLKELYQNTNLQETDVIIQHLTLNYANKDRDPGQNVRFYKGPDHAPQHVPRQKISLLIPNEFQERYIRVFIKPSDDEAERQHAATALQQVLSDMKLLSAEDEKRMSDDDCDIEDVCLENNANANSSQHSQSVGPKYTLGVLTSTITHIPQIPTTASAASNTSFSQRPGTPLRKKRAQEVPQTPLQQHTLNSDIDDDLDDDVFKVNPPSGPQTMSPRPPQPVNSATGHVQFNLAATKRSRADFEAQNDHNDDEHLHNDNKRQKQNE